jgi:CRISPR-associated protein Cas2
MAEPRHLYLLSYDVMDPKRLRKVHKKMVTWGKPVQYSVFRVRCTDRELGVLRFELAKLLDQDDRLLVVRLCAGCASRVSVRGKELEPFDLEVPACKIV